MKNKKALILVLAIIAIAALVLSGCSKQPEKAAEEVKQSAEKAEEKVEEAVETVKEEAGKAAEEAAEKVEEAAETVKEEAGKAAEEVAEKVEEAAETVKEEAGKAAEEAAEKVEEAVAAGEEAVKVMSYDEFIKAELDSPVCIEAYVQANQSWWDGKIKLYLQDENHGAYFAYDLSCTEEEAAKLAVPGTKIRLSGIKAEWSGEVEIIDATYEILEGSFVAEPEDVTALLGKDDLINHMNEKVAFKGLKIAPSKVEGKEEEFAFLYAWDGSGSNESNSDLYFNVELDGQTFTFTVESYLCGNGTDVYKAVEGLKVGDTIDCEGFLYWYNGANPHITSVTVK